MLELIAREVGKKVAEAQKRAAADEAARRAASARSLAPQMTPQPTASPAPKNVVRRQQPVDSPDAMAFDVATLPGLPAAAVVRPELHLLAAFGGGSALLAGIVLAEALAPPVALRGSQLFDRIER